MPVCCQTRGALLPHHFTLATRPARLSANWTTWPDFHPASDPWNRSAVSFCCTFRQLAPPRHYLAPCPVEPGLSSACLRMTRLSGRLRRLPFYGFRRRVIGGVTRSGSAIRNLEPRLRVGLPLQGQQHPLRAGAAAARAKASLRAGAAAARGFRPPRGSASCSNTRARYIRAPHKRDPLGRNPLAATSFAA